MRCDICGKSDTTFFISREGGSAGRRLCAECARERGFPAGDAVPEIRVEEFFGTMAEADSGPGEMSCPDCGMEYETVRKTGRLGCDRCVSAFRASIASFYKRTGRPSSYEGRLPKRLDPDERLLEMENLRFSLDEAVNGERFEKAAELRDRLKGLSGESA